MLNTIKNIICPDALLDIETHHGCLKIKETAPDSALSSLTVEGLPTSSIAFTLDHQLSKNKSCFKQLSCYLNPSAPYINKGCDAVIIAVFDSKLYISILDMKSKKPKIGDIKAQLNNSEVFVKYIIELIKVHYPDKNTNTPIYCRSFVTTRICKGV